MLETSLRVTETILAFAMVVLLVVFLKRKNIISQAEIKPLSRLMTTAVLPAVIFLQLSLTPIASGQFVLVMIMFFSGLVSMIAAWGIGWLTGLKRETVGMLMITSTFGSSALIGYPMIQFTFPGNAKAMSDAILISELGVGLPIFTLCPLVAAYFGKTSDGRSSILRVLLNYLRSPIFISVVAGIGMSCFPQVVKLPVLEPLWEALRMIQGTLTVMACLFLGLQLRFQHTRRLIPLFVISAFIQMGLQPFLVSWSAGIMQVELLDKQVLILIAAMPAAVLSTVFTSRFDCDAESASSLVFLNIIASLAGIPLVFYMIFH